MSTVLWPLEVDLVLKEAAYLPREEGMVSIGSGASARLKGRIQDRRDAGAPAEIRFVAGTKRRPCAVDRRRGILRSG